MKKLTLLLIGMLALTGCPGKSGKSDNYYTNPNLIGSCMNCNFSPAAFSQPVSATLPQGTLTLEIAGDVMRMNQSAMVGMNPLFAYQGPITVSGSLMLNANLPMGMCMLPPGQYYVRGLQSGIYNMGTFQVPMLEISGPTRAIVTLTEGTVLTNGNGSMMSFGAMIYGQQGPNLMTMGMPSNCSDTVGVRF